MKKLIALFLLFPFSLLIVLCMFSCSSAQAINKPPSACRLRDKSKNAHLTHKQHNTGTLSFVLGYAVGKHFYNPKKK